MYQTKRMGGVMALCAALLCVCGCFVTPTEISETDQWKRALDDMGTLFGEQESPDQPITLGEAVARAVKYNLDHRLAMMEEAFHLQQLDVANLNMLPRLALNAGYSIRDKESASSSISYHGRYESLEPSVSSEKHRLNGDLSFSWSILDFGLSYFQAKQQADRFLILRERRRRIMNNLVKDVITDYFRVATAEAIGPEIEDTLLRAEKALATYQEVEDTRKAPLQQTLEHQRSLINTIGHLRMVQTQLAASRSRLAALMNLPLATDYRIAHLDEGGLSPPRLSVDLAELETIGIYLRPDLREETYQARIDKLETKKEILRMVPGLSFFGSGNYDSNKYLVHQNWAEAGLRATVDIIGLAAKRQQLKAAKAQVEVSTTRRLANTLAALVQINLSYFQYRQAIEQYSDADKLYAIENKLLNISTAGTKARELGELEKIRQSALTLNARLERDRSLVEVLAAWGNLYFSVGGDILTDIDESGELDELRAIADDGLANWLAGGLPPLPEEAPGIPGNCIAVAPSASPSSPAVSFSPAEQSSPLSLPVPSPASSPSRESFAAPLLADAAREQSGTVRRRPVAGAVVRFLSPDGNVLLESRPVTANE